MTVHRWRSILTDSPIEGTHHIKNFIRRSERDCQGFTIARILSKPAPELHHILVDRTTKFSKKTSPFRTSVDSDKQYPSREGKRTPIKQIKSRSGKGENTFPTNGDAHLLIHTSSKERREPLNFINLIRKHRTGEFSNFGSVNESVLCGPFFTQLWYYFLFFLLGDKSLAAAATIFHLLEWKKRRTNTVMAARRCKLVCCSWLCLAGEKALLFFGEVR